MRYLAIGLFICLTFLLVNCQEKTHQQSAVTRVEYQPLYDFSKADKTYKLPKSLNEISGIAHWDDDKMLAVQDEKGMLYVYSFSEKEVIEKIKFGANSDYEGLCLNNNIAQVINSNGSLYSIDLKTNKTTNSQQLKDFPGREIEGIDYDSKTNEYLIAYKGQTKQDALHERSVYRYSDKFVLLENEFRLGNKALRNYLKNDTTLDKGLEKVLKNLVPIKPSFYPSDIAIHPNSGDLYLLSAVNELLIILDSKTKQIKHLHQFKHKKLPQPEGISFKPDGTLYISSEKAGNDEAVILKFKMK